MVAEWLGVAGNALQLLGAMLTLWGLLSATGSVRHRLKVLVTALWRSMPATVAADLSTINEEKPARVLQGLAVLALGYLLALVSQVWLILASR
jgi:hypothetical protein